MATFSQGFLSSLGRPQMAQSLFGLGQTIGGVPGQLQQRKQRREEAGMLAGLTPGSVEYNQAMAKIAQQRGELERAAQFGTAAEQQRRATRQQEMASQQERGKQALSKFASARGMTLSDPRTREAFFRLASTYQVPVEEAASIYSSFEDLSGQDEQTRVNNDLAAAIEKQYPKVARALKLGDPEAKKFAYKVLTNSLEEGDEKDIEYKFGQSTDRARDSEGNQYLISTRKNPNTGEVVVVHSPIGDAPKYDAEKQGNLTFISRQGETASEKTAREVEQEDLETWKEQRGKLLIDFSKAPEVVAKAERAIAALENINTSGFDAAIKQYPKVARALKLGDPEAKKFAYKVLTNSLEEGDEKDIEYKFGQSTDRARDSEGNQYLISTRKNPNTGEVVVVHSPIGDAPKYDAEKQGNLTFISRQGETASEKTAREVEQEDLETWKEQRGKLLIDFSKAPEVVAKAERAIAALENINTSGFDAAIKQVTDFTGTTSADVGVFNSSVSDFILESLGQLGANPTEGEREFLVAASASLKTSKDVNRALLNRVKNTYQDIIERGRWLVNNPDATRDEYVNWMLSPQKENEMVFDAAGNRIR